LYNLLLIAFIIDLATGRLSRNVLMTGSVLFNGKKRRLDAGVVSTVYLYATYKSNRICKSYSHGQFYELHAEKAL
jgi:hypothetical protein